MLRIRKVSTELTPLVEWVLKRDDFVYSSQDMGGYTEFRIEDISSRRFNDVIEDAKCEKERREGPTPEIPVLSYRALMNEKKICQHIQTNMEKWLFVGHVADRHINAPEDELLARLGKYDEDGRFITCASSFVDETGGDNIVQGLISSIQGYADIIMTWLCSGDKPTLKIYFNEFPDGVSGIGCAIGDNTVSAVDGYMVILCKDEQFPFYLLNAYPVR